ncbi:suppressor of fused domain protein [Kibdelosporangium aridum]|uniref:suppressor of fused domain protein n=1 Tax=Kibdelosporangium aridum TaxID=2030 RepID=UPI000527EEAB
MGRPIESLPLFHHLQAYIGEYRGTESKPQNRPACEYSLDRFEHPSRDMTTITSNGLRFIESDVPFGEEIACTLRKSQAGYTRAIMGAICEFIAQRRRGIEYGQILDNHGELFDGSRKEGLLASTHPCFDNSFNYLPRTSGAALASGNIELQIITLIPIASAEIDLAARDIDALYEHWDKTRPDLLDITRPSTL